MLVSLYIQNYALINSLNIELASGFTILTGETGAGKSILLGALSLIVGQRADTSVLNDKSNKCIVEGTFNISEYKLKTFFEANELDYAENTVIRREINAGGLSRAFINDTPVNLNILKELGWRLIDIHSQHQNLALSDNLYQLKVVDAYAQNADLLKEYELAFKIYKENLAEQQRVKELADKSKADQDYFQFQFNQLEEANFQIDEQANLELELETLTHAEEIKLALITASQIINDEGISILNQLKEAKNKLSQIKQYYPLAAEYCERMEIAYLELKDISSEASNKSDQIDFNPEKLLFLNQRLDLIYSLQQKHRVQTIAELLEIKETLQQKLSAISSYDLQLEKLEKIIAENKKQLTDLASKLTKKRTSVFVEIEKNIVANLVQLGMPNASFKINHEVFDEFKNTGTDKISFLFSANKNGELLDVFKVASGGELSRLMLSIKSLISSSSGLPTIIFDEIDSGVSGDIADKMAVIMRKMSSKMQVISITHLPQIASKGDSHFVVYKQDNQQTTYSNMKQLNNQERIIEIAKMLSGEKITEAALQNAKELLQNQF